MNCRDVNFRDLTVYVFRRYRKAALETNAGFNLTFQKRFVSFLYENNRKLKCHPSWLGDKEKFSLKIA